MPEWATGETLNPIPTQENDSAYIRLGFRILCCLFVQSHQKSKRKGKGLREEHVEELSDVIDGWEHIHTTGIFPWV